MSGGSIQNMMNTLKNNMILLGTKEVYSKLNFKYLEKITKLLPILLSKVI